MARVIVTAIVEPLKKGGDHDRMTGYTQRVRCPACRTTLMIHRGRREAGGQMAYVASYTHPRLVYLADGTLGVSRQQAPEYIRLVNLWDGGIVHCPEPTCGGRRVTVPALDPTLSGPVD